jgi:REP element-mobilizing transposase RayT
MARQAVFEFRTWGGKRRNAGRKPRGAAAGASHRARKLTAGPYPLHVTMRLAAGLPSLREQILSRVVLSAFRDATKGRAGAAFRIVQFSVQSNHVHLVVEADDRTAVARGAGGLATRIARRVNGALGRRGGVFADRFHAHELRTPSEVRRTLVYVLANRRKHAGSTRADALSPDPLSSAPAFDGWRERIAARSIPWLSRPETWLARTGWARAGGLLSLREAPT